MRVPTMTLHARQRCEEMGITTIRAKRVVSRRVTTYAGTANNNGLVCLSDDPEIAVVWDPDENVIITVIYRTYDRYERPVTAAAGGGR